MKQAETKATPKAAPNKSKLIVDEIMSKVSEDYADMTNFMSAYNGWADLYRIKKPGLVKGEMAFSNPRLTEFHRAAETLATMMYRMSTAQEPFFDTIAMEYEPSPDVLFDKLNAIEAAQRTQLEAMDFNAKLLRAYRSLVIFGTVFVEENYKLIGASPFGRQIPVTNFQPRSMLQVSFDRSALDLDEADWIAVDDLYSPAGLMALARDADKLGQPWDKEELDKAAKEKQDVKEINEHVRNRLVRNGYTSPEQMLSRKLLTYYRGKLDTLDDGLEYVAAVVNGRHLVRFHANDFQHGLRNIRIAKWIDFELEPRGLGLGDLYAMKHREMDANRRRTIDGAAFSTYSMWKLLRGGGVDVNDLKIAPFNIVEMDDINALQPMQGDTAGPQIGLKLDEIQKQEFRAATGATDTLQAIVTEATASEVSLAQNEAVRRISVVSEHAANSLIRKHLRVQHYNNVQYIKEPINVNWNGNPKYVYPVDLQLDVDFKLKIVTDKDFRPKRTETLVQVLQILTSIRNEHPEKYQISVLPIVMELAKALGVPPSQIVKQISQVPQPTGVVSPQGQGIPGQPPGVPGLEPSVALNQTPVGPVLGSA